jgi:hypothetical protein
MPDTIQQDDFRIISYAADPGAANKEKSPENLRHPNTRHLNEQKV